MKNIICISISVIVLFFAFPTLCRASDTEAYKEEIYNSINKIDLPQAAGELGIDITNPDSVSKIDGKTVLKYVISIFRKSLLKPSRVLAVALVLSIVSQITSSLSNNSESYEAVFVLICFISISSSIISSFNDVFGLTDSIQAFMAAYVPILASISLASGNVAGAISYNSIIICTCEAAILFSTLVLKPLLICMSVLSVTQSINTDIPDFINPMKKVFITVMGLITTVFTGIISLQTTVGRAAEGIGLRAGKYLVSSFIPILGYTINQSYQTIKNSLSAIRSAIGAFGIVIILIIFSIPIISLITYRLVFKICEIISSLCQCRCISKLFSALCEIYSMFTTVIIFYMLMLTVSTGVIITLGEGLISAG